LFDAIALAVETLVDAIATTIQMFIYNITRIGISRRDGITSHEYEAGRE
jgi:hypothetical protein